MTESSNALTLVTFTMKSIKEHSVAFEEEMHIQKDEDLSCRKRKLN